MEDFTKEIEVFRMEQKEQFKAKLKPDIVTLNELEKAEAVKLLKSNHLIKELKGAMKKTGLIGETDNGLLLFLIFLTRHFDYPLHALVHGSSGSGKTNLLKAILRIVPEESKYSTTALRSEEHTSELQSRPHLVCRLLLEKKKKNKHNI